MASTSDKKEMKQDPNKAKDDRERKMASTSYRKETKQDPNKALDDREILDILERKLEKKEEQVLKMEASVFQLANYYFVFQGVILTATINGSSSTLKCNHFWLPFSLSLIGAVLNIGTLLTIADKYKHALIQLDDITLIFYQHLDRERSKKMHNEHKKKKTWRKTIMVISMILFCIFALINLIASWMIPCRI